MLKIFRKVRQNMLKNNKVTAYILYALGEIILVMIGILLALQVNNWNEERKQKSELNNILRTISYDLETDTLVANRVIEYYEESQKSSKRIINREITMDNYKECPLCPAIVTLYRPLNAQTKGYELLKNYKSETSAQKDSLVINITQVYSLYLPVIEKSNERLEDVVLDNLKEFQQFPFFVDWTQGNFTDEVISYFAESEDFRKRVASHNILASGNHLATVREYKRQATEIIKRIKTRLED